MNEIGLDASTWLSVDDFYSALLTELGAPSWHGHNLNALWDSLTSDINRVDAPFRVIVRHTDGLSSDVAAVLAGVADLFAEARAERGVDVWFSRE